MTVRNFTEEFRFAMPNYEPYSFACANHTPFNTGRTLECPYPGASYELFLTYVQAMGVKPKLIWISEDNYGSFENGTWTGALGMVLNGTLDTIAATYQQTEFRERYFDFSYSFYEVKLVYLVKEAKKSGLETILDIFLPFRYGVWLTYIVTIVALLTVYVFICATAAFHIEAAHPKLARSISDSVWDFFRYLINSCGEEVKLYSYSGIFLFISGAILSVIMMNLYGGILLSQHLSEHSYSPFSTADGVIKLIEQGRYKMILDRSNAGNWYYQETLFSNDSHYVQLRKALSKNPYTFVDNQMQAMEFVRKGGYILPRVSDDSTLYNAFNMCDVAFISPPGMLLFHPILYTCTNFDVSETLAERFMSFATIDAILGSPLKLGTFLFRHGSPLMKRFNSAVFSAAKVTDRIWANYYGDVAEQRRANNCKRSNIQHTISIDACLGFFALLCIGFFLAALVLIAEVVREYWASLSSRERSIDLARTLHW